jgi:hypothetical protein
MLLVAFAKKRIILLGLVVCVGVALYLIASREFEIGMFAPKRPGSLPANAIWIDAPPLPFTYAHGWWLGCVIQGATDVCDLVGHNDRASGGNGQNRLVSSENYLSCRTLAALKTTDIELKPPHDSTTMWVKFDSERDSLGMAPVAFLKNGDVLVPTNAIAQCPKFLNFNSEATTP